MCLFVQGFLKYNFFLSREGGEGGGYTPSKPLIFSELDKIQSLKNEMVQVLLFRLSWFSFYLLRLCILDSCLGNWEVVFFYCT